jgi:hypothetical protein
MWWIGSERGKWQGTRQRMYGSGLITALGSLLRGLITALGAVNSPESTVLPMLLKSADGSTVLLLLIEPTPHLVLAG